MASHDETVLRTARLVLRRGRPADVAAMHAVLTDAETMRYWSTPPHTSVEQTRVWMAPMWDGSIEQSEDFVVELDGVVVGKCGFHRLPEIGFILRRDLWGRGLALEAARAVIEHVRAVRPDVGTLVADVDPGNAASLRLLTRLGFVETGRSARTWLVGGEWKDSVYLALAAGRVADRDEACADEPRVGGGRGPGS